jgi:exodeoxyribonuclease V
MIKLSSDQKHVLTSLLSWYKKGRPSNQFITLGGYAGTGKTTLIAFLRKRIKDENKKIEVAFACFTGKASLILKNTLKKEDALYPKDSVSTIHSLIYSPIENERQEIIGWQRKDEIKKDLIIIDEASMVDSSIWRDLLTYQVPIIAVGDHGQLPPIKGSFNLMEKPKLKLEQIHRQARQDPIIDVSIQARTKGIIKVKKYSADVIKYDGSSFEAREVLNGLLAGFKKDMLVLCGYNHTRKKLNDFIRQNLGFTSLQPQINDRVICLRNNHEKNIFNGMLGTIKSICKKNKDWYEAEIKMDGEDNLFQGLISVKQFNSDAPLNFTNKRRRIMQGDLFDFGYTLTVHKAQGGQAKKVVLIEERFKKSTQDDWQRWLYTGVTRAQHQLYIFGLNN